MADYRCPRYKKNGPASLGAAVFYVSRDAKIPAIRPSPDDEKQPGVPEDPGLPTMTTYSEFHDVRQKKCQAVSPALPPK